MPIPKIHILLIEDNLGDIRLIEEYFREIDPWRYRLTFCETLEEGKQILRSEHIDAILLDLGLPDSMGLATFERLNDEFSEFPIIVLTGMQDKEMGRKAVGIGAQDFLEKHDLSGQVLSRSITYAIERKQMFRNLEQAQELAKVGNWRVDLETNEFISSPQLAKIFELEPGRKFLTFEDYILASHVEDQKKIAVSFQQAVRDGSPFKVTHQIFFDEHRTKYIILQGQVQLNQEGHAVSIVGTIQDITDRKKVEDLEREKELAKKAAKLRQEFLAKTSHEIRTPLNPILLLTDMLLETPLNPNQREYLSAIKTAGETLLAVVNDILDLSKIEAGKIDFSSDTFSIARVFESILDMMEASALEKGIELEREIDGQIPEFVIGDTVRLTQIILNLVGNAIKFTSQGTITVGATFKRREVGRVIIEFDVKDTGIGIPHDKLKVIFDSFQQLDTEANQRQGGTGLGLTIVRQLIRLQGGNVSVESEVGKGSRFFFELGFNTAEGEEGDAQTTQINSTQLAGLNVLLIEDHPLNQVVTQKLLSDWGIELDIANNGREGIERLEEKGYDLVLMDVQMPVMNGYEATRYIRKQMQPPKSDIPIIALTANAFSGSDDECLQVGMDDYVSKPIETRNLFSKIVQHTLGRPRQNLQTKSSNGSVVHSVQGGLMTETSMESTNYVNLSYLKEISGGDGMIIRKTIQKFLETTPAMLDTMDAQLAGQEYPDLGKTAHKLKSSVAFMGIDDIKDSIIRVETITKSRENVGELAGLLARIRQVTETSFSELRGAMRAL
ncbi:MAG: response regulator [Bacteroidota bacterium]